MTNRSPVCDGHGAPIAPGVDYATVVTPGEQDKHLCSSCASLVWQYMPALIAHRALHQQAEQRERALAHRPVRERALSLDLPAQMFRRK